MVSFMVRSSACIRSRLRVRATVARHLALQNRLPGFPSMGFPQPSHRRVSTTWKGWAAIVFVLFVVKEATLGVGLPVSPPQPSSLALQDR